MNCFAQNPAPAPAPAPAPSGPVSRARIIILSEEADAAFAAKDYGTASAKLEELLKALGAGSGTTPAELELLQFNLALAYFLGNKPEQAITAFENCLKKFPAGAFATRCWLGIGRATIALNDKSKQDLAVKALRKAKEDRELRSEACLALGQYLADMGDRKGALEEFRSLMGADVRTPEQTSAAVSVIGLLADNGELDDLIHYLDRLLNQAGVRDAIAWYTNQVMVRADDCVASRAYDTALTIYQFVPSRAQIISTQTEALAGKRKALKLLEETVAREKANPQAPRTKAASMATALKASIESATGALETIEKLAGFDAALLMRRGRCLYYLKRFEEALVCFRTLRTKYASTPDAKSAAYAEIIIYSELKDYNKLKELCDAYLVAYPDAENAEAVATLAGELLVQDAKWPEVVKFYSQIEKKFPNSPNLERFIFFQAAGHFYAADFDLSTPLLDRFIREYPQSPLLETALYYRAMTQFLQNKYKETLAACRDYLKKFPDGHYAGDIQYRLSFVDFNDKEDQSKKIISDLTNFVKDHPQDAAAGSMECLLGDTYKRMGDKEGAQGAENMDAALDAYKKAVWSSSPDDVVQYALDNATTILQGRKDWSGIADLHAAFLKKYPNSPLAMLSVTWVARMKTRDGKQKEAAAILGDALKSGIANPASEQVEQLIDELVKVSVPRKKASEIKFEDIDKDLVEIFNRIGASENVTANARLNYARARLGEMLKRPDRRDLYLRNIAKSNADDPSTLSPTLLALSGDILLKDGDLDGAERMFKRLADRYKDSMFADAGPVGLGYIALARKQPADALAIFDETLGNSAGTTRIREATLGRLKALTALGKYDDAEKLAGQMISDKSFRGEYWARAYMARADICRQRAAKESGTAAEERLKEAYALYQRVYLAFKSYPDICADAYWSAYEVAKEMGKDDLAQENLEALAKDPKLQNTSACERAKKLLP